MDLAGIKLAGSLIALQVWLPFMDERLCKPDLRDWPDLIN